MSKARIWEAKESQYFNDFSVYISVSMSEDYNPQEVTKDLREFKEYLLSKYKNKNRISFWDRFKLK